MIHTNSDDIENKRYDSQFPTNWRVTNHPTPPHLNGPSAPRSLTHMHETCHHNTVCDCCTQYRCGIPKDVNDLRSIDGIECWVPWIALIHKAKPDFIPKPSNMHEANDEHEDDETGENSGWSRYSGIGDGIWKPWNYCTIIAFWRTIKVKYEENQASIDS